MEPFPLMNDNITREDVDALIAFLDTMPRLTQSARVAEFENAWSRWLGVKHSVFVNSGASANFITIGAFRYLYGGGGEIIVPPLTWVSDISSVLLHGFTPVFADIDPRHLGMAEERILEAVTDRTRAVFLTHVQGFDALSDRLLAELKRRNIPLIEDVCESHGATHGGRKLGSFGLASDFSFYFAHHMSTIEGGMVCTDSDEFYEAVRMYRSHGMAREISDPERKRKIAEKNPQVSPDFTFLVPSCNFRGTEIGGVLGLSQLKRLDENNRRRTENFHRFLKEIDPERFRTEFRVEGSSNYAFPLVIRQKDFAFRDRLEKRMREYRIEFRRGNAGGGNQLRQPYLKGIVPPDEYRKYPEVEHIHDFGYYIGNYPTLPPERVSELCRILNEAR